MAGDLDLYDAFSLALGVMWFTAGSLKMLDLSYFASSIKTYSVLPEAALRPTAIVIAGFEVLLGLGLLLGTFWPWPLLGSAVMAASLGAAVLIAAKKGRKTDCGCLGRLPVRMSWRLHALVNVLAVSLSLLLAVGSFRGVGHSLDLETRLLGLAFASATFVILASGWNGSRPRRALRDVQMISEHESTSRRTFLSSAGKALIGAGLAAVLLPSRVAAVDCSYCVYYYDVYQGCYWDQPWCCGAAKVWIRYVYQWCAEGEYEWANYCDWYYVYRCNPPGCQGSCA